MSPGIEVGAPNLMFAQPIQADYEHLCRLDVLGLADRSEGDQEDVYCEFKEQLERDPSGWYQTGLPWRGNHLPLATNEAGSKRRLRNLVKRLEISNLTEAHDSVIQDQMAAGVIEKAPAVPGKREFYLPHKPVVRETASTTKLRIVYDGSARATPDVPSINDCLNPGPSLQSALWDILVRERIFPIALTGDIQKAFLQIRVKECDRDALRFHWDDDGEVVSYRFTRVLFGLTSSPFLLNGVLCAYLDHWAKSHPHEAEELRKSLYVDDIITGGTTVAEVQQKKDNVLKILHDGQFKPHIWASNDPNLDLGAQATDEQLTSAKTQLGAQAGESKILGLTWDKERDTLSVQLGNPRETVTKRIVLGHLARIYDPLGVPSPLTLTGKQLYREVCDTKMAWDAELSTELQYKYRAWEETLSKEVTIPRALPKYRESIDAAELHAFGDASAVGVSTAVYAVIKQSTGVSKHLVAAKSRLAKRGLIIPRLELVAAHTSVNYFVS